MQDICNLKTQNRLISTVDVTLTMFDQKNQMACDSNGDFLVLWDHDDTDITLEFQVKTTGWFGFGISPAGTMAGADIITYSDEGLKVSSIELHV